MNRHPLDTFSLISGLLFVTLGTIFMLDQADQINLNPRWIPAIVMLVLGFGGIVSNGRRAMRPRRSQFDSQGLSDSTPTGEPTSDAP